MTIYINKKIFEDDDDNFQEIRLKQLFDEESYNSVYTGKIEKLEGRVDKLCEFIEMFVNSNIIGKDFLKYYCENSSFGNYLLYKDEEVNDTR